MSKIDEVKDRWHRHAVSYSDMEWLFRRIDELEKTVIKDEPYLKVAGENAIYIIRLEGKVKELEALFALQRTRMDEATKMWQKATGKADVLPDLGDILAWFMERIEELEKDIASYVKYGEEYRVKLQFAELRIKSGLDGILIVQKENTDYWEAVLKQLREKP